MEIVCRCTVDCCSSSSKGDDVREEADTDAPEGVDDQSSELEVPMLQESSLS